MHEVFLRVQHFRCGSSGLIYLYQVYICHISWRISLFGPQVLSVLWLYLRGGRLLMSRLFARSQFTTMLYQELVSPNSYKDRDASKAWRDILSCGLLCILLIKTTSWKRASTKIRGKVKFSLIMLCGTADLFRNWRDNIVTNGLFNCIHIKVGRPRAQTIDVYMREWVKEPYSSWLLKVCLVAFSL